MQFLRKINLNLSAASLLIVLSGLQAYWMVSARGFPMRTALFDVVGSYSLLYLCFLFIRYGLNHYFISSRYNYLILAVQSLIIALAWMYSCEWTLLYLLLNDPHYAEFWELSWAVRMVLGWVLLYDFCLFNLILHKNQKIQQEQSVHQHTEQLRKEAELFMLRQQLQPHFLFNSLNSINALIGREPQLARTMVQQLSEYLRHTLKKEDEALISFQEEIDDLHIYLNIEQIRFGHRLKVSEAIEEECLQHKIPPFLLQPLIENAIKYGLYGTLGEVTINITAYLNGGKFFFKIVNPYDPHAVAAKGTGFGLESVKRRLYLLFGRNDLLELQRHQIAGTAADDPQHYFTAVIQIPRQVATISTTENPVNNDLQNTQSHTD